MRAFAWLLAFSFLFLAAPTQGRAEIVSFEFTGHTVGFIGGTSALGQALTGQSDVTVTGSFSYDDSPYTTVGASGSSSVVSGSLSLTIGGVTIQSIPNQPVQLVLDKNIAVF